MRLLLFLVLSVSAYGQILAPILQGAPAAAGGNIAFVNGAGNCANFVTSLTTTYTPTSGSNTIVAYLAQGATAGDVSPVIADNNAHGFGTRDGNFQDNTLSQHDYWFHSTITGSPTSWIASNLNSGGQYCLIITEWSGMNATPLDASESGNSNGFANTAWLGGAITPTAGQSEVILGGVVLNNGVTGGASGSFLLATPINNANISAAVVYQIVASTSGSYTATGSRSGFASVTGSTISYKH